MLFLHLLEHLYLSLSMYTITGHMLSYLTIGVIPLRRECLYFGVTKACIKLDPVIVAFSINALPQYVRLTSSLFPKRESAANETTLSGISRCVIFVISNIFLGNVFKDEPGTNVTDSKALHFQKQQ